MSRTSASSYVSVPINKGDPAAALAEARHVAAERVGGEDGLTLISQSVVEQDGVMKLATTWLREWDEPDPTPLADAT